MHPARALALLALAVLSASTGLAQETPPLAPPKARVTLSFEPSVWYVAPGGKARFPGAGASTLRFQDINMDSPRLSSSFELNADAGRWGGTIRASIFGATDRGFTTPRDAVLNNVTTGAQGVLVPAGAPARTSLDFASLELEARYRLVQEWRDADPGKPWRDMDRRVDVVFGVRLIDYDLDIQTQRPSGAGTELIHARSGGTYPMPLVGLKGAVELNEQWTFDLQTTFAGMAGNRQAFSWDIMVGFQFRPISNVAAQVGYRQLLYRLHDGSTGPSWDGAMAGFFGGLVIRF